MSVENKEIRIGNNKLSYHIINKIMSPTIILQNGKDNSTEVNSITDVELDLLLYLSKRQDVFGSVEGIYYKDLMLELGCSKQSFYNAFYGLELKGYIQIDYSGKDEHWKCIISNNIFQNEEDDKEGYFNTNRPFLYTPEFKSLTLNEKKLCILLTIKMAKSYEEQIPFDVYPSTIASWLGVRSTALVYRYCNNIEKFFPNVRVNGAKGEKIVFTCKCHIPFKLPSTSERVDFLTYKIKYFCKLFNVSYTSKDIKDLIILMAQYASKGIGKLFSVICNTLIGKRSIEPALINSLLNKSDDFCVHADIEENEVEIVEIEQESNLHNNDLDSVPVLT